MDPLLWRPWCALLGWRRVVRRLLLLAGWRRVVGWAGKVYLAPPLPEAPEEKYEAVD